MEHGMCEEDPFIHFCMGQRARTVHAGYLLNRVFGAVRGVSAAMSGRGPHLSLPYRVHRRENLVSLLNVPCLSYQAALVLAWSQGVIR